MTNKEKAELRQLVLTAWAMEIETRYAGEDLQRLSEQNREIVERLAKRLGFNLSELSQTVKQTIAPPIPEFVYSNLQFGCW